MVVKIYGGGKDQDGRHDRELRAYRKLEPLQGTVVPKMYGQVVFDGQPALAMEYAPLQSLHDSQPWTDEQELQQVEEALLACYNAISAYGVMHREMQLANILDATADGFQPLNIDLICVAAAVCTSLLTGTIMAMLLIATGRIIFRSKHQRRLMLIDFEDAATWQIPAWPAERARLCRM